MWLGAASCLAAILAAENALLRELVETYLGQLQVLEGGLEAKLRDIQELHVLLQRSQDRRALLEPKTRRWWACRTKNISQKGSFLRCLEAL
jgi:hypothetical protein